MASLVRWVALPERRADTGSLTAVESGETVPFEIKRVYYLYGLMEGTRRGFHAHRELEQVAVCVAGACKILLDDGRRKETAVLDEPRKGLFIGKMVWREMFDFSPDCVLLVFASEHYDEADYIRSYAEFRGAVEGRAP